MTILLIIWRYASSVFSAAVQFCSKPPGSWVAAAIAACLGLWWFGQHEVNVGRRLAVNEAVEAAKPIIIKQQVITERVVTKYLAAKAADTKATNKRLEEVPIHVTKQADAACPVTLGFVRVFNGAAHGPVPDASAGTDDTATAVKLSEVGTATVQNDGQYDAISHQLIALQEWVRDQRANNK